MGTAGEGGLPVTLEEVDGQGITHLRIPCIACYLRHP